MNRGLIDIMNAMQFISIYTVYTYQYSRPTVFSFLYTVSNYTSSTISDLLTTTFFVQLPLLFLRDSSLSINCFCSGDIFRQSQKISSFCIILYLFFVSFLFSRQEIRLLFLLLPVLYCTTIWSVIKNPIILFSQGSVFFVSRMS